ncbi:transglutaminase family protein [Arcobacter acticola]|jgi:transglutaminase-like putative cysteine protease|uniref:Transglutaminase family protein n=1 Tax=Arcobacter acticola TaxID=1849015 RepID=A0A6M8EEM0_9BACT|nr:transglutaminase family protein [Arcobacter acticola]QKE30053.1 transglutaminase family protein [Arcobacter acticola]
MIYEIYHETKFEYGAIVTFSHNIARLKPKTCLTQTLLEYNLNISPKPYETNEFVDYFENTNNFMLIRESHKSLIVTAISKVERINSAIYEHIKKLQEVKITFKEAKDRLAKFNSEDVFAKQYLFETDSIPTASDDIKAYVLESFNDNKNLFESINEFMKRIFTDFKFVSGFSDVTTPIETIFREKKGVCQDFAQFAISSLRSIGIPTRYVSGYLETLPPEGKEKLFGADASHAWFSAYIPGFGWADFDPTNNKIPNEEYIILGYGRDYLDIAPLKGVVQSSGNSILGVKVNVQRVEEKQTISAQESQVQQIQFQSQTNQF